MPELKERSEAMSMENRRWGRPMMALNSRKSNFRKE